MPDTALDFGYHSCPAGSIATVVTCLEMYRQPVLRNDIGFPNWRLDHWRQPGANEYRDLFRRIGQDWLWFSRLQLTDAELLAIIHDPDVFVYRLHTPEAGAGLLELDFRRDGECELAFFGLSSELVGKGAGRWLMNRAQELIWSHPINRLWVHTCTLDHPRALDFYRRTGFIPFCQQVEIIPDPRLNGLLPRNSAPQIPCLEA